MAVAGMYSHGGELRPEGDLAVAVKEYGVDIATSMALTPTLSVGAFAGGRQVQFASTTKTNGWGQVGMFYYPSPGISYGWAYRVSSGVSYWSANAQRGVINEPTLSQNLEISATMTYPSRSSAPIVTLSLASEKYFPGVSLFSTKGGLEVYPVSFIALRVGFKAGTVERIARYGVGLRFDPVRLDLAVGASRSEDRFAGISLSVSL
jgi:hypothetical protein